MKLKFPLTPFVEANTSRLPTLLYIFISNGNVKAPNLSSCLESEDTRIGVGFMTRLVGVIPLHNGGVLEEEERGVGEDDNDGDALIIGDTELIAVDVVNRRLFVCVEIVGELLLVPDEDGITKLVELPMILTLKELMTTELDPTMDMVLELTEPEDLELPATKTLDPPIITVLELIGMTALEPGPTPADLSAPLAIPINLADHWVVL